MMHSELAQFFHAPSFGELLIVAFVGLLLFGKRLPEVGKSLGKGIVEFKKGLRGIEDDLEQSVNESRSDRALPRPTSPPPAEVHSESEKEKTEVHSGQ